MKSQIVGTINLHLSSTVYNYVVVHCVDCSLGDKNGCDDDDDDDVKRRGGEI